MIGSKTGGIPDAVKDGVTGMLVEPNNTQGITQAIIRLLTNNQMAMTLGKNGRLKVENEFSRQVMRKRIITSLQNLKSSIKNTHHA